MGVVTYKTSTDMPERLRNALPDQDELLKMIEHIDIDVDAVGDNNVEWSNRWHIKSII